MTEDNTYIKYTRALHNNPNFKSLSYQYRHIFITILVNMAFKPMRLNDHGKPIDIQPGQMMITYRQLVKLCDEEDIDLPKVQRALKRFEELGFSIQETIHTKTIITIIEPSICKSLKMQDETTFDTRSIQDRYKIDTQKKNEKKEENEKKEHTQEKIACEFSSSSSSLKKSFGKQGHVKLTDEEYSKLISEEGMIESEREYWIQQIELTLIRQGEKEFNQKNKSHFHAIIAWKLYREDRNKIIPIHSNDFSEQENKIFAEDLERNYFSSTYLMAVLSNRIEIYPQGPSSKTIILKFSENGFKDQIMKLLELYKFGKVKKHERA